MRTRVSAALAVGLLCLAARADEKAELEKFTGSWQAVSWEVDGKKLPQDEVKGVRLTVKGAEYTFHTGEQAIRGKHRLDPGRKPKEIDAVRVEGPDAGKTIKGIYELGGDTFKVCFAQAGQDRPTAFSTGEGDGRRLMTFKRQKE